jgi:hypothetical protein
MTTQLLPPHQNNTSLSRELIKTEFTQESAISPEVLEVAVQILTDLEIDPLSQEVIGTPIHEALGWTYTRFGHQVKPNLTAAAFIDKDGNTWQVKVYGENSPDGKSGAYWAPKGSGDRIYFPAVPFSLAQTIAEKHGLTYPEGVEFWQWLKQHPEIRLTITEGGKKCLALISQGEAAVSLYGCLCGVKSKDENDHPIPLEINPQLWDYVHNRDVIIALDRDSTPKAKQAVNKGIYRLGITINQAGGRALVAWWEHKLGKGIDDVIARDLDQESTEVIQHLPAQETAARKSSRLELILEQALAFEQWKVKRFFHLDERISQTISARYLPANLAIPQPAKIVAISSPYGTGKTRWFEHQCQDFIAKGGEVLVITHRIQLAKHLASRFGIDHIETLQSSATAGIFGYSLCIDSVHPYSQARFNPERFCQPRPLLLIIDEVEQVLWHLLNSWTCRDFRSAIIPTFQELLQRIALDSQSKIFIGDNDLSLVSIEFLENLSGMSQLIASGIPMCTHIIVNQWKRDNQRDLLVYQGNTPQDLIAAMIEKMTQGQSPLIHTGAQRKQYAWSSQNLEQHLQQKFPNKKILRIDRDSVADPQHPAYKIMDRSDLSSYLKQWDGVICSPVVETGISIEPEGHFDSVWIIAQGTQTVDAVAQSGERNRDDVPRHLWCPQGTNKGLSGNGCGDVYQLLKAENQKVHATLSVLQLIDSLALIEDHSPVCVLTWAKYAAKINSEKRNYRSVILAKFTKSGYQIKDPYQDYSAHSLEKLGAQEQQQQLQVRDREYLAEVTKITEATNPHQLEYEKLKEQRNKTECERLQTRKGDLTRRYLTEDITESMVIQDDRGWFGQLTLHYLLTLGRCFCESKELQKISRLTKNLTEKKAFGLDVNQVTVICQLRCLEILDIQQFFQKDVIFTQSSLSSWFEQLNTPVTRWQILTILGITINPENDSPISVAQRLLKLLGLKLKCLGRFGSRGNRQRNYQIMSINPDGRDEIFRRWWNRDAADFSAPNGSNSLPA